MLSRSLPSLLLRALPCLICALCHGPAQGVTTVYRCGEVYQTHPCPGGNAMRIVDDRTEAQREQALDQLELEQRHAQTLRRERLERERLAAAPMQPGRLDAPAPPQAPRKAHGAGDAPCEEHHGSSRAASPADHGKSHTHSNCPAPGGKGSKKKKTSGPKPPEATQPAAGTPFKAMN